MLHSCLQRAFQAGADATLPATAVSPETTCQKKKNVSSRPTPLYFSACQSLADLHMHVYSYLQERKKCDVCGRSSFPESILSCDRCITVQHTFCLPNPLVGLPDRRRVRHELGMSPAVTFLCVCVCVGVCVCVCVYNACYVDRATIYKMLGG